MSREPVSHTSSSSPGPRCRDGAARAWHVRQPVSAQLPVSTTVAVDEATN